MKINIDGILYQLTVDQVNLINSIMKFMDSDESKFVISGAAGTGKSTVIIKLLKMLDCPICLTATTNKAVAVLDYMIKQVDNSNIKAITIHSLLGLVVKNTMNGKELVKEGKSDVADYQLVIVDEASMVDRKLFSYIEREIKYTNTKFLFVGDVAQLPPINEQYSIIFDSIDGSLDKIVRQARENPILRLAKYIREVEEEEELDISKYMEINDKRQGVIYLKQQRFENLILRSFYRKESENPDYVRVIAWTNKQVEYYNNLIRSRMFEGELCAGEYLRVKEPVFKYVENATRLPLLLNAQTEGIVKDFVVVRHPFIKNDIPFFKIKLVKFLDNKECVIYAPTKTSRVEFEALINRLAEDARAEPNSVKRREKWFKLYQMKDVIADVVPLYAITAHSSQGSTYDMSFIDLENISLNRKIDERLRCFYVALTRSKRVSVVNSVYVG